MPGYPGNSAGASTAPAESARITKELLQEIRRGDAAMADDLVALAPRSGRAFRSANASKSNAGGEASVGNNFSNSAAAAAPNAATRRGVDVGGGVGDKGNGYSVSVNDTLTASDFVKQKREVGLVRMSLATKKAEIRKLDEKVDRAEKRLRQQQEQLTNTQEKFNNFLKFSNLEQDAAVRKADDETRAKHAKTIEIKKLSALINHAELETRKTRLQIDNCVAYKEFLESLAKSQWFYDVLIHARAEDKREEILLNAETVYQQRCEELKKAYEARAAARLAAREMEERESRRKSSTKKQSTAATNGLSAAAQQLLQRSQAGGSGGNANGPRNSTSTANPDEVEEEASVEQQMEDLHDSMEDEARAAITAAENAIRAEVTAMPLTAVKAALHRDYDESRLPMCFSNVDELLEVFINVEEGNLFLIQNCQELEEELEGISIGFMEEKAEMNAMVAQRTAQLSVLEENIAEAREKLKGLDDRIASLEPRNARGGAADTSTAANANASGRSGQPSSTSATSAAGAGGVAAAALVSQADLSPEELKVRIESSIGHMFQLLTAGDQLIKTNATKRETTAAEAFNTTNGGSPMAGSGGGAASTRKAREGAGNASLKGSLSRSKSQTGGHGLASPTGSPRTASLGKKGKSFTKGHGASSQQQQQQQQQQQRDASMGPVEMLTIVENKLEEYHRYLTDPANHLDVTLIQAVMKQSDKQRRRQARLVHLASQEQAQEERIKRALERSQAPIAHRTGKPARPRSHVVKAVDEKTQRKADRAAAAMEGSGTSIDSDEDGAEFFH